MMLSLATVAVGENSKESERLLRDMLLQDRVLVSPDITHTLHTLHYCSETYIVVTPPHTLFTLCLFPLSHTHI